MEAECVKFRLFAVLLLYIKTLQVTHRLLPTSINIARSPICRMRDKPDMSSRQRQWRNLLIKARFSYRQLQAYIMLSVK